MADISCALIAWQQATHSHFFPGWGDDTVRAVHAGEQMIAFAASEENAGSDLSAIETRAVLDGDSYVLRGQKISQHDARRRPPGGVGEDRRRMRSEAEDASNSVCATSIRSSSPGGR